MKSTPIMGRAEQITTNHYKKMIAKEFTTITLRNLDEKPQLTEAMNAVMQKEGIRTGQAVIEFIIADHAKKSKELEHLKQTSSSTIDNLNRLLRKKEDEIKEVKETLKTIKTAFRLINSIKD